MNDMDTRKLVGSVGGAASDDIAVWISAEEVAPGNDADTIDESHIRLGTLVCPCLTTSVTSYECAAGVDLPANTTYLLLVDSSCA